MAAHDSAKISLAQQSVCWSPQRPSIKSFITSCKI